MIALHTIARDYGARLIQGVWAFFDQYLALFRIRP